MHRFLVIMIMSDGNFNRSLLPHTDFQSGVRVGRMAMKTQAEEAFREVMDEMPLETSDEVIEKAFQLFRIKLNKT